MSFKKILVAVDGSAIAARAVDVAAELADELQAHAALVYAIDPALLAPGVDIAPPQYEMTATQEGDTLLADARAMFPPAMSVQRFIVQGPPGAEIVKTANEWRADLIVLGSHGRSGIARAFVGSVAEAVMRHAACPVLVVRGARA